METQRLAVRIVSAAPSFLWVRIRRVSRRSRATASPLSPGTLATVRIRLADSTGRAQLRDAGLHAQLLDGCSDELRAALQATRLAIGGTEVDLERLQAALVANLQLQPRIRDAVYVAVSEGGVSLDQAELFDVIALWLLDLQLGDRLRWQAEVALIRPPQ
jgi:hypothetical protein